MKKIDKKDLSDFNISSLPDGFSIIFDGEKPIAAITNFRYFKYIQYMIKQVKDYIAKKEI
jgi:hypothetical protein